MTRLASIFVLVSCLLGLGGIQLSLHAEPVGERTMKETLLSADTLLLDEHPNAHAAYSLGRLRSDYSGPAIRVRRGSDDAEQDFGFGGDDKLDTDAVESWLSGADGYVTTWYSQVEGEPDLVQSDNTRQPYVAKGGTVTTDSDGRIGLKFDRSRNTYLTLESGFSQPIQIDESLIYGIGERVGSGKQGMIALQSPGERGTNTLTIRRGSDGGTLVRHGLYSGNAWPSLVSPGFWAANHDSGTQEFYSNHERDPDWIETIENQVSSSDLTLGVLTNDQDQGYDGFLTEVAILPGQPTEGDVQSVYDIANGAWLLGPVDYNPDSLMPQTYDWQVTLYDWLQTVSVGDVTLPNETIEWDGTLSDTDEMADLWLQLESAGVSRVVNSEPDWYVLDAGNGKGIEATGDVRVWHDPGYGGNQRSWAHEPAHLYQLSVPKQDGSEGNGYKGDPALGKRALVVAMVDMIVYMTDGGYTNWTDMHGKALLSWAETYRWCKDILSSEVKDAYEKGLERSLDKIIDRGARGVNTNMDMFSMHAAAEIWMTAEDQTVKDKALRAVKRTLLGSVDADQVGGANHEVFAVGNREGGVFSSSGYIMEGDQAEVFYNGESYYHLVGAYAALLDRDTGTIPNEWSFLEEIVKRMSEWKAYQLFYDHSQQPPGQNVRDVRLYNAGAGFSGRTSHGEPRNQSDEIWRDLTAATMFSDARYLSWKYKGGGADNGVSQLPGVSQMEQDIDDKLSSLDSGLDDVNTGQPPEWTGWSPWVKSITYLPEKGWYSTLDDLQNNSKSSTTAPIDGSGTYNKPLGGPPKGNEFWAYKESDGSSLWGFFVEAMARQGGYGGWYGGKIETFWTEDTGIILMNRHGKSGGGCGSAGGDTDPGSGGSLCAADLERYPGHHVWGRDESSNVFTTLWLRGRELTRTSTFNTGESPPTVAVNNVFNDPSQPAGKSGESGEETGSEIEGNFEVKNTFEAQSDGLKVTHTLTSNQTDQVTELWATLPVYLKAQRKGSWGPQMGYDETSIEYWDGGSWRAMPEDISGDGVPERINTTALRLGRDFELGNGIQYAYVSFASPQSLRLAKSTYSDPYQTRQMFRSVHIDLHGNPGTVKTLPAEESVSYTVQTTDPTSGDTSASQVIPLQKGWNIASTSVAPATPAMDSVFAGLQSEITVVKNEAGERYRPDENINEIGQWNSEEVYQVYAESDVVLTVQGHSLGSPSIALEQGENWIPYFPSSPLSVEEAVSSITEDLVLVKDEAGRVYSPDKGIEVLEQMEPGEGYKVYVRQSAVLSYPDGSN